MARDGFSIQFLEVTFLLLERRKINEKNKILIVSRRSSRLMYLYKLYNVSTNNINIRMNNIRNVERRILRSNIVENINQFKSPSLGDF